jgi:hypothetical protein
MAPCTYVRLALGAVLGGRICFGSLEFIDVNGPTPAFSLLPYQALHFGDLDFIAAPRSATPSRWGCGAAINPNTHSRAILHWPHNRRFRCATMQNRRLPRDGPQAERKPAHVLRASQRLRPAFGGASSCHPRLNSRTPTSHYPRE